MGPLPLEELGGEEARAFVIRMAETTGGVERIALDRGIRAVQAFDLRDCVEVVRVSNPRQFAIDAFVEPGASVCMIGGEPEIGEGDQAPVQPSPLAIGIDLGGTREVEEGRDDQAIGDALAVLADLAHRGIGLRPVQQPGARPVPGGRLIGLQQPVD